MAGPSWLGHTPGTMTDVTPVLHARPVDGVSERVSSALRGGDAGPQTHGTEHPAAVRQHLAQFEPRA